MSPAIWVFEKKKSENFQLIWNFISTNNSFQMNAALQGAFVKQK